jgi:hypothetical protein
MTSDQRPTEPRRRSWTHLAALVGIAAVSAVAGCDSSRPGTGTGSTSTTAPATAQSTSTSGPTTTPGSVPPSNSTPSTTTSALTVALTGAYTAETRTLATYKNVIAALGSIGPFPKVITAEEQHVSAVTTLLDHYAIAVPAPAAGQASPDTLSAACNLGVTLEQQVISLYNDQLPKVSAYRDVTTAFANLRAASRDNHLPAFQRCA